MKFHKLIVHRQSRFIKVFCLSSVLVRMFSAFDDCSQTTTELPSPIWSSINLV